MKKIAIIRRNGLGDLLCAYPLVRYFQQQEPKGHITLFVSSRNAPLVPYLTSPVDAVVTLPDSGNKYFNLYRYASRYRGQFDLAISAKTSPMQLMNFFLYALKAKKRMAYVDGKWHSRFVNYPIHYAPKPIHQTLKSLRMVMPDLTEVPEELYPVLHIPKTQAEKRYPFSAPVCLVSATTTGGASRLSPSKIATSLNRLYGVYPISIVVIGQRQDKERALAIAHALIPPHCVHFPQNFEDFMLSLNGVDCFFTGDGGVAHVCAALGKPGVVLFGQTNPAEWSPLSKKVENLYHPTHVDQLPEELIVQALKRMREYGRDD